MPAKILYKKRNIKGLLTLFIITTLSISACQHTSITDKSTQEKESHLSDLALIKPLYLRGAFNGWGIAHPFVAVDKNHLTTEVDVTPGNYGFKIASENWSTEWVINTSASDIVEYDKSYVLTAAKAPEDFLFALKSGRYQFTLDMTNIEQPKLTLIKKTVLAIDPINSHLNADFYQESTYENFDETTEIVGYSVDKLSAEYRQYTHSSTLSLRDPGPQHKQYVELHEQPKVRSGNIEFDALFALAINEMKNLSVSHIRDGNYDNGKSIPCDCFKTGQKWEYVWTRDLSYAADLSFALLDPKRVQNSLNFKTSNYRNGIKIPLTSAANNNGIQIIQDTGSGGSWPVSTDRVTWAFAADELLKSLHGADREYFAEQALPALINTIENDRFAAYDKNDGLYTGEQSFLDWRDQTYATWIVDDLSMMATSKALSTNVAHYQAITLTVALAKKQNKIALVKKYQHWAEQLKKAINNNFWLEDAQLYSSLTGGHFNNTPLHKFDWLGLSLAIISGIADEGRAQQILANYPHGPMGAPVIFPQQQVAVYHNRAIWPFVTAYGLKAAKLLSQVAVADAAYDTLIRGAAVNMSNMENLEWLTGQPMLLDKKNPELSGPVINSNYQLWSVAAYLNMVIENIYGITLEKDGITVKPFITTNLHKKFFKNNEIELSNLTVQGKTVSVKIFLPELKKENGYYAVDRITVNGKKSSTHVSYESLGNNKNTIEVYLTQLLNGKQAITKVEAEPIVQSPLVSSPLEAKIENIMHDKTSISFSIVNKHEKYNTHYNVFRDGKLIADRLALGAFKDRHILSDHHCYTVEAVYESGNRSHHSKSHCVGASEIIQADDQRIDSNVGVSELTEGLPFKHIAKWGKPTDHLMINDVVINKKGKIAIQINYHNDSHVIGQGITAGVKILSIYDVHNTLINQGVIQLPHVKVINNKKVPVYSTPVITLLDKGIYHVSITDFYNMSYLESNKNFSATGGLNGVVNQFDFIHLRLQSIF